MMQITTKGQVTIPQNIRDKFGFLPHTEVEFVEDNGNIIIRKTDSDSKMVKKLLTQMRGAYKTTLSTDEIMKLTRG
jgi:AbrB family looped-hinge helix DNA binding protein